MEPIYLFYLLLFAVAFLYASVGHGGASGYLALMALFSAAPEVMKPTALLLNVGVSLISFIQFYRAGHFNWKLFIPFAIASIPMAFIGGLIMVDAVVYKKLLGLLLLIPAVRFLFFMRTDVNDIRKSNWLLSVLLGGTIGFLSGLIGIGGGIILSPILLLLRWTNQKQTAAISALFILVNSLSGLAGQLHQGISFSMDMYIFVIVALAGGFLGAYLGAFRFKSVILKNVLATVLLLATYKLLFTNA
jgi:uncharacterized membrane protein YfcA